VRRLAAATLALLLLGANPAAAADDPGRCPEPGTGRVVHCRHTVVRGEWLWSIARANLRQDFGQARPANRTVHRRAAEIRSYNPGIDADHLRPGQVLRLYPWVGAPATPPPPPALPSNVTVAPVGAHHADAQAVAIDASGRIVTAGQLSNTIGVFRFDAAGRLDTSFGSGGHVSTLVGTFARATAVAVQPDGRMVVAGATNPRAGSTESDAVVVRYLPTGALDPSFGTRTFADGDFTAATGVAVDAEGRIVVVGLSHDDVLVLRYLPDGTLDPTFGTAGRVATDVTGGLDVANAVAIDGAGRIVVVGTSQSASQGTGQGGFVVRYLPTGALDPSFPRVLIERSPFDEYRAVQLAADGSILAAGSRTVDQQTRAVAVLDRFGPDATLLEHRETPAGTFAAARGLAGGVVVGRTDDQAFVIDRAGQARLVSFGAAKSALFAATLDGSGQVVAAGCTCDGAGGFGRGGREIPSAVVVARYPAS
jgi:uncharacterized delta-60 repeat protein